MEGDWFYRNSCEDDVRLPVDKAKKEKGSKIETRSFLHKHTLLAREMVIVSKLINGKLLVHSLRQHFKLANVVNKRIDKLRNVDEE